jgi:thioesterase domain-containing protein
VLISFDPGTPLRSLASVECAVAEVWKQVLGRQHVAHDTNYWDLGRGARLAIRVLERVGEMLDVNLPMTVLYECSTITAMAKWIFAGTSPKASPLVLLKPGKASMPPLFIVSGIGGVVLDLFPTGNAIDYDGPVYAIQPKGVTADEALDDSIEEMAASYVKAIREVQPHGPYLLSGYSLGGYAAIEMTRLLEAASEPVPFLALLDCHPFEAYWPFRVWLLFMLTHSAGTVWQNLGQYLRDKWPAGRTPAWLENTLATSGLESASSSASSWFPGRPSSRMNVHMRIFHFLSRYTIRFRNPEGRAYRNYFSYFGAALPLRLQKVVVNGFRVLGKYRPPFFEKEILFFGAESGDRTQCDPLKVWPKYLPNLKVRQVPGDHRSMLHGNNARVLAREMSSSISAALGSSPKSSGTDKLLR